MPVSETIVFEPRPENMFERHILEYFERSRDLCPKIEAIYGKWRFEDLIPGMSDFDTRFLVSSDTDAADWVRMSKAVGRVHTEICREYPDRARLLEHLPGINLSWREIKDPRFYYPEFHQWTGYFGNSAKRDHLAGHLASIPWSESDELFNLRKFALYFTPYNRSIDPPINLGPFESKYPLHSRFMHYFCPPLQCAVSLIERRMILGKAESFRLARDIFPNPDCIDMIFDAIDRHYELPSYYVEPRLSEIEDMLYSYLKVAFRVIQPGITVADVSPEDSSADLKAKLAAVGSDHFGRFYEGAKFCRLMMGRLLFYAEDIPHFDSSWLIEHELGRIRKLFYETTFGAFGHIAWKEKLSPEEVLERAKVDFLGPDEYRAVRQFAGIFNDPYGSAGIKVFAVRVAEAMGAFQMVLEKLSLIARKIAE